MTVTPATRLDDRYLLVRRLAFGGMGEVWEGSDVVLDRPVAVKILRAELADDDAFRRRFRAEARTAGRVPHPGIAAVYDYGETSVDGKDLAYLVMELVPGEALSAVLAREGALGTDRALDVVAQAARALHAAHERGVVHRDVKPANLMVTPDGRVKVTDFGIARPDDHEPLTATGQVMGTAHYLAPELARGRAATAASDIYALGVVAYECLAGRRPFEGDDQIGVATAHLSEEPPPLPATIAPDVRGLVAAAMEKDSTHRIGGADVFAAAAEGLRLRAPGRGGGYAGNGHGGPPTGFALGAAAGAQAVTPPAWPSTPFSGAQPAYPGSGSLPAPGTAAASGALLAAGGPVGGAGDGGDLFQRPVTAPLPLRGDPRSGGIPARRRRRPSVPLAALVGLVLLVVIGTAVATLRQTGPHPSLPGGTPTPTPTSGRQVTRPTPGTTKPPSTGGRSTAPVRPSTTSPSRTVKASPSPTTTPTPTTSVSPPTSPPASPSPSTPTASGTTPGPTPTPTPTSTTSPSPSPAAAAGRDGGVGRGGGSPGGSSVHVGGASAIRAATVDTVESGTTT